MAEKQLHLNGASREILESLNRYLKQDELSGSRRNFGLGIGFFGLVVCIVIASNQDSLPNWSIALGLLVTITGPVLYGLNPGTGTKAKH